MSRRNDMQHVSLTEWETVSPTPGSPLHRRFLAGDPEAQRLAETLRNTGRIEILELAGGLELRASSFVGRFALGDLMVTIRPKIPGMPLMNLLRYAYRLRHFDLFGEVGYAASAASFEDLLIHQLAAEASELLPRGLHRDYVRTESTLVNPRGRIDFSGYLQAAGNARVGLPCTHHPRGEDTKINRALHGGLEMASRMTHDRGLAGRVRRLAKTLASRGIPAELNACSLDEAWHSLDRRTRAYQPSLTLIRMLFRTRGAALGSSVADISAAGFLFDMNRFLQALLLRFLTENLVDYEIQDESSLSGVFSYDAANNPRQRLSPTLRPDYLVLQEQRVLAVLDAKYRDLWERSLPREMLYQLALYAMGQDREQRRATILYPTLVSSAREQIIHVNDPLRGTAGAAVILRPVNLLNLDRILRATGVHAQRQRRELAHQLVFGAPQAPTRQLA